MRTAADTAWRQIPIMTKMAVGAREAKSHGNNELSFKVGKRQTWIRVTYCPGRDLYDVKLEHIKRKKDKASSKAFGFPCWDETLVTVEQAEGLYADMLGEAIDGMVNK